MSVRPAILRSAFALVGLTAFLLVFGSTVRVHGAGLACPDWPLCFGQVVPEIDFQVGLEFGHRVVAGVVSLCFFGLIAVLVREGVWAQAVAVRRLVVAALLALATQVVLGGLTVLELLAEWTVASHLVTGNTFAALLLALALGLRDLAQAPSRAPLSAGRRALPLVVAALVPLQVALGGFVAGSHAGLACGTWPSCNGAGWFPTFEGLVGLQVMHRLLAYTLLGLALGNAALAPASLRRPAWLVLGAIVVQATIGVSNVLLRMPVEVTLLHSAGAAAVYLSSTWMVWEAVMAPSPSPAGAVATLSPVEVR